jgi:hypothetical protein
MINVSIAIPFYFYGRKELAQVAQLCFKHYAKMGIPVLALGSEGDWSREVFLTNGFGQYLEYPQSWSDVLTNDSRHILIIKKYQAAIDHAFATFNSDHVSILGIDDFLSRSFFDYLLDDMDLQGVGEIYHLVYEYEGKQHRLFKRFRDNVISGGISTGAGLTISKHAYNKYGGIPFANPDSSEQHVYRRFASDKLPINPILNTDYATLKTDKVLNTLENRLKRFPGQFNEIDSHPFIDQILELKNG